MKNLFFLLLLPAGLFFLAGCESPTTSADEAGDGEAATEPINDEKEVLQSTFNAYNAAFSGMDAQAIVDFYTEDAVRMYPDTANAAGKEAILARMGDFRQKYEYNSEVETHDVMLSGDLGVIRSSYRDSWWPKEGGDTTIVEGKWLTAWEKGEDGIWKLATELWSEEEVKETTE